MSKQFALPKVFDDSKAGALLGAYVTVMGVPERDSAGRLTQLLDATIEAASDPLRGSGLHEVMSVEDILASAPGPDIDGGIDLTDEEFAPFLEAVHS